MFEVTGSWSKLTPGPGHYVAHLNHGRNMYAKFELPVYNYRDLAETN